MIEPNWSSDKNDRPEDINIPFSIVPQLLIQVYLQSDTKMTFQILQTVQKLFQNPFPQWLCYEF